MLQDGGKFFGFGGRDWVASASSSLPVPVPGSRPGRALVLGGYRARSSGLLPVTLGSDSEVASGVAAWSFPLNVCLWVDSMHLAFC